VSVYRPKYKVNGETKTVNVWWYKFRFAGQVIRESSKSGSKTVAKDAERARRRELEENWNQIKRRKLPPLFSLAAADWIKTRTSIASSTERSYKLAISQLENDLGKRLLCDISADDLAAYQNRRKRDEPDSEPRARRVAEHPATLSDVGANRGRCRLPQRESIAGPGAFPR
jgi:hypothetical protein